MVGGRGTDHQSGMGALEEGQLVESKATKGLNHSMLLLTGSSPVCFLAGKLVCWLELATIWGHGCGSFGKSWAQG